MKNKDDIKKITIEEMVKNIKYYIKNTKENREYIEKSKQWIEYPSWHDDCNYIYYCNDYHMFFNVKNVIEGSELRELIKE